MHATCSSGPSIQEDTVALCLGSPEPSSLASAASPVTDHVNGNF